MKGKIPFDRRLAAGGAGRQIGSVCQAVPLSVLESRLGLC